MSTAVADTTTAADTSVATDTSTDTTATTTTAEPTTAPARDASGRFAAAEPTPTTEAAPVVPVVPETYDLTLPENAALDAASLERTAAFARERGLSNEAATAALHLANTEVAAALAARTQAETTLIAKWEADTLADPTLGATVEDRKAAIQKGVGVITKFAEAHPTHAPQLKSFLEDSGLGNHPAVVHLFKWLGEAATEGSLVTSQIGGESRKSDVDVFYGAKG